MKLPGVKGLFVGCTDHLSLIRPQRQNLRAKSEKTWKKPGKSGRGRGDRGEADCAGTRRFLAGTKRRSRSQWGDVTGLVVVAGDDRFAVGRVGDVVGAERRQLLRQGRLAVGQRPDVEVAAVAARDDALALGRQGQAVGV